MMAWILIIVLAYLLFAVASLADRYLLAGPLPSPGAYAFFVGAGGALALLLVPFGFLAVPTPEQIAFNLFSGAVWVLAILLLYTAVHKSEVTRAAPAIGALIPIFTLGLILVFQPQDIELGLIFFISFSFSVIGSLLIAFDKELFFANLLWFSLSALLFGIGFLTMKSVYSSQPFLSGFIWMRIGGAITAAFFLFSPKVRNELFRKKSVTQKKVSLPLIAGQLCGGAAFLLQNYAVSIARVGQIPLINALEGLRYVFLLSFVIMLNRINPGLVKEKMSGRVLFQKAAAIILISIGLFVLALPHL